MTHEAEPNHARVDGAGQPAEGDDRIVPAPREDKVTDNNTAPDGPVIGEGRRTGLGNHRRDRSKGNIGVIGQRTAGLRGFRGSVLEIGKPNIDVIGQRMNRFDRLISAAVVENRNVQTRPCPVEGGKHCRQVMGRGNQIKVMRTVGL